MYCPHCGNELINNSKFCSNCGFDLNSNKGSNISTDLKRELPMNWWNFWKFIRFPLALIILGLKLLSYQQVVLDIYVLCFFIANIIIIFLTCFTYSLFLNQNKNGYKIFNIYLFVETVWSCAIGTLDVFLQQENDMTFLEFILVFLIVLAIYGIIWLLPNYAYFKRRKMYFYNNT